MSDNTSAPSTPARYEYSWTMSQPSLDVAKALAELRQRQAAPTYIHPREAAPIGLLELVAVTLGIALVIFTVFGGRLNKAHEKSSALTASPSVIHATSTAVESVPRVLFEAPVNAPTSAPTKPARTRTKGSTARAPRDYFADAL